MKNARFTLILALAATISMNAQSSPNRIEHEIIPICEHIATSYGVAKGRVASIDVYRNQEQTRCYYHFTLEVQQVIKGKLPERIVIVQEFPIHHHELIETAAGVPSVGAEIMACFKRIPRDWECGYTPRHAYASVVNYDASINQLITCLQE